MPNTSSPAKTLWFEEGLAVLGESGSQHLTIDVLCRRLKLTKGAFYHHFGSREIYSRELLEFWEERYTRAFIAESARGRDADQKLRRLGNLLTRGSFRHEIAIRAWALTDAAVRDAQERIDAARFEYVRSLYVEKIGDRREAALRARILLCAFVGAQQIIPPITGRQLQRIFRELA